MGIFDKIRDRGPVEEGEENEMSFLDHIEELRWHLIRSVIVVVVAMIGVFIFLKDITDKVILAPYSSSFPTYQYLCKIDSSLCNHLSLLTPAEKGSSLIRGQIILQATSPSEQFTQAIFIAIIGGLTLSFPYLIWEIWRFVKPGLTPKERRGTTGFIFFTSFLFFTGVLFAYYIVSPFTISFLAGFTLSEQVVQIWKIADVISLVVLLCVAGGILFEMPMLAYFLGRLGIINSKMLATYRRHAVVVMFIAAGVLTPSADMYTQIVVVIPLLLLYEISIWVVKYSAKPENTLADENEF
ncbi:MAG: twin-arginine translocase subunit TatC [Sphingobacteriia bacterium]|nr:twin-arginine translocase subunit TatC [Sphingobacteriia bacterium]